MLQRDTESLYGFLEQLMDIQTAIPCPYYTLTALRRMRRGAPIVVTGPGSFSMFLDGMPYIPLLLDFLVREDLVQPQTDDQVGGGIGYLRLSDKGYRVAKAGEHWWASLPWKDKLKARLGHQV